MEVNNSIIAEFIDGQMCSWDVARMNYEALSSVRSKCIRVSGTEVVIQFNPGRVRSTAANVTAAGTVERPCFLCAENRPPDQDSLKWNGYDILLNPFPIFLEHLTIAVRVHAPQYISGRVGDMLSLAESLSGFSVLYNGPRSGASAPDHMHFQAVPKGSLPFMSTDVQKESLFAGEDYAVYAGEDELRMYIIIVGNFERTLSVAEKVIDVMKTVTGESDEAKMNIIAEYDGHKYKIVIFPRGAHRPQEFFDPEPQKVLFSPGVVDYGGVVITVREEDFNKMDSKLLKSLFLQLTLNRSDWQRLLPTITDRL